MAQINLDDLLNGNGVDEADATKIRILDATLDETAAQGLHGLTIGGVARRCKMNRATIYRQFGGKEELMAALALREAKKLVAALTQTTADLNSPDEVFAEGFANALSFAREHPVISRLAKYEPGAIVEFANADNATVLRLGGSVMASTVLWAQSLGFGKHLDANDAGDVLARLFSSFVIFPNGHNLLDSDEKAKSFARRVLLPMLFGPT